MAASWSEAMSTGVPEVDNQHKELFSQINYLREAMQQGKGRDKIEAMLDYLADYALRHFATEERWMARLGCPAAAENKRQHADFAARFKQMRERLTASGVSVPMVVEMSGFLSDWLVRHISGTDAQMRLCAAAT